MKKLTCLLLILPSLAHAVNVTDSQAKDVQEKAQILIQEAVKLYQFATNARLLIKQNFEMQVQGTTTTVTMPTAVKNEVVNVNAYNAIKNDMAATFNSLP